MTTDGFLKHLERPAFSDGEKIAQLIEYIRSKDSDAAQTLQQAEHLKKFYDDTCLQATEARAELKKFGIMIDNTEQGIQI